MSTQDHPVSMNEAHPLDPHNNNSYGTLVDDVYKQVQLPVLDALYGSATFVPMSDGALFEVSLANSGLIARPLNERAQSAIERWR